MNEYYDQAIHETERRGGGYEPVFCRLDDNQDEIRSKLV